MKMSDEPINQIKVQLTDHMVVKASQAMAKIRDLHGVILPEEAQIMMAVNAARAVVWAINHPEEAPTQLTYGAIECVFGIEGCTADHTGNPPPSHNDATTQVILQDHTSGGGYATAMPYPDVDTRKAWNVGDHRLVRAWPDGEHPAEWLCFDHGWECAMTKAAQTSGIPAST